MKAMFHRESLKQRGNVWRARWMPHGPSMERSTGVRVVPGDVSMIPCVAEFLRNTPMSGDEKLHSRKRRVDALLVTESQHVKLGAS